MESQICDLAPFQLRIDSTLTGCDVVAIKLDTHPHARPRRGARGYFAAVKAQAQLFRHGQVIALASRRPGARGRFGSDQRPGIRISEVGFELRARLDIGTRSCTHDKIG
jgi:hypothetical protein